MTDDIEERVYAIEKSEKKKLDDLLAENPYEKKSFARVSPKVKEIEDEIFIYIKADSEFFKWADEKFKVLETLKMAEKDKEEKIKNIIKEEEEGAAGGFGSIFG